MNHNTKTNMRSGSYIIEALVAISLVFVGLLGVFGLITRSTNMNKDVQNRVVATYLAGEGIEVIKNIIDTNVEGYNKKGAPVWNAKLRDGNYQVQYDTNSGVIESLYLGNSSSTTPLSLNKSNGRYSYLGGETTIYFRTVRVEGVGGDKLRTSSFVDWTTDGKNYSVFLQDTFTNWRDRNTPVYNP